MRRDIARNSTNVRLSAPLLAAALWFGFVGLLACTCALATLASDVPLLSGFACGVALLAYAVDTELKRALERHPAWLWIAVAIAAVALCAMHAALLLSLSPIAAVSLAAAASRGREPRVSSTPAASPGASRAAP